MIEKQKNIVLIESRFKELEALSKELDKYGNVFLYTTLNLEKAYKHIHEYNRSDAQIDMVVVDLDFYNNDNVLVKNSIDFIKKIQKKFPYIKVVINSNDLRNAERLREILEDINPDAYYLNLSHNKDFFISVNKKEGRYYKEYAKTIYHNLLKTEKTYLTQMEKDLLMGLIKEERLARLRGKIYHSPESKHSLSLTQLKKVLDDLMIRFEVETKYQLLIKAYTLGLIPHITL